MTAALPAFVTPSAEGVYAIDTGFQRERFDAAWLLVDAGRAAFIDTGTNLAVPRLLAALEALGIARDAVDWVIPTHVHLDHAGGAGLLMQSLPAATMLVHPRGVRHMVDPSMLWDSATAIYGAEEMARSYGRVLPTPADRVRESADGQRLAVGGRELLVAHTPGHARHHHCVWDAATRGWFTGDTFGLSYREFDTANGPWIMPTATPVQFEPGVLRRSIERMLSSDPQAMYLTHFGRVGDVARLGDVLLAQLQRFVVLAETVRNVPDRHAVLKRGLLEIHLESLARHGCTLSATEVARLLALDLELNAQGIAVRLDRGV